MLSWDYRENLPCRALFLRLRPHLWSCVMKKAVSIVLLLFLLLSVCACAPKRRCPACRGTGCYQDRICVFCGGTGHVP